MTSANPHRPDLCEPDCKVHPACCDLHSQAVDHADYMRMYEESKRKSAELEAYDRANMLDCEGRPIPVCGGLNWVEREDPNGVGAELGGEA